MKVFSKFHDYYDTAICYGIDPNIKYIRKQKEYEWNSVVGKKIIKYFSDIFYNHPLNYLENRPRSIWNKESAFKKWRFDGDIIKFLDTIVIVFCGNVYVGLELQNFNDYKIEIFYDSKTIKNYFEKNGVKWLDKIPEKHTYGLDSFYLTTKNLDSYFKTYNKMQEKNTIDFHFDIDSPIVMFRENTYPSIIVNPCLKDFNFYKCVDPYTAFQELSMFIGGIMGGKSPIMVEISDEDRISMHGFDKWSFRKMKG